MMMMMAKIEDSTNSGGGYRHRHHGRQIDKRIIDIDTSNDPDLKSISKFRDQPWIPGMVGNLLFYAHGFECLKLRIDETSELDTFECDLVMGLVRHLILNQVLVTQFKVVTNNKTRMRQLNSRFQYSGPQGYKRIEVGLVGDARKLTRAQINQGYSSPSELTLNKVTILLLVGTGVENEQENFLQCFYQAMDTSESGLIILSSFRAVLETYSPSQRWKHIVNLLHGIGAFTQHLSIHCSVHDQICCKIRNGHDFKTASPFGGCLSICYGMHCGHFCGKVCHPNNQDHAEGSIFTCFQSCGVICPQGHPCVESCTQPCRCEEGCEFRNSCGHPMIDKKPCELPCPQILPCFHSCPKYCYDCTYHNKQKQPRKPEKIVFDTKIFNFDLDYKESDASSSDSSQVCQNHFTNFSEKEVTDEIQIVPPICEELCDRKCPSGHYCQDHPCSEPCPPCRKEIVTRLHCGHVLARKCFQPKFDIDNLKCGQKCRVVHPLCGHPCPKKCHEECGMCEQIYERPHPICGHYVKAQCHIPITEPCQVLVPSIHIPPCGHIVNVPCNLMGQLGKDEVAPFCNIKCHELFPKNVKKNGNPLEGDGTCGHYCFGNCFQCIQGRFHVRCETECGKHLICGHVCKVGCPLVCPPCMNDCMRECAHYKCDVECGVPCDYICTQPCTYSCPHKTCSKTCDEICDNLGCTQPCPNFLECGHPCVGFCGEICPAACLTCSPGSLMDLIMEASEDDKKRYISIPPCGHIIEEASLTRWLNLQGSNDDDEESTPTSITPATKEIRLKTCPICLQPILLSLRRYSKQIMTVWNEIQKIKRKIRGAEEEIEDRLMAIKASVIRRIKEKITNMRKVGLSILDECNQPMRTHNASGVTFDSMYLDRVKCIEWAYDIWIKCENRLETYQHTWKPEYYQKFKNSYKFVFRLVLSRDWPLHVNEVHSVGIELDRINDLERLYSRLDLTLDDRLLELGNSFVGRQRFKETEAVLLKFEPYSESLREEFKNKFTVFSIIQRYTLNLSEDERKGIVEAFGSRAGRWFKCPNGHVYVVTECGGVTEIGKCNECGSTIGGENHQVLQFNQLATEMDGAQSPMYPTALQR